MNKTKKNYRIKKIEENANSCLSFRPFEKEVEDLFKRKGINFESANYLLSNSIIKDLKTAINPSNIKPQNDYYSYINDRWIESYKHKSDHGYIVQVDDFRLVQDKVYHELIDIVENALKNPEIKNTKFGQTLSNFYKSQSSYVPFNKIKENIKNYVSYMDSIMVNKDNLWLWLGEINNNELYSFGSPILWTLNPDDKNPKYYKSYVGPGQVTLIDYNLYYNDGNEVEYKKNYLKHYFQMIDDLFILCFGKDHDFNIIDVYDCEKQINDGFSVEEFEEEENGYNLLTEKESLEKIGFNWKLFAESIGFKTLPKTYITSNLNYLYHITKILKEEWNGKKWRTYFIYIFIKQAVRFSKEGVDVLYPFFGKFVLGQDKPMDPKLRSVFGLGLAFSSFLNNEYIKQYSNKKAILYSKYMAEDLKVVFERILKRNTWMQDKTKKKAIEKLQNFSFDIGSKMLHTKDPLLNYMPNDPWGNLSMITLYRHKYAVSLEGKHLQELPAIDWAQFPPKFIGKQSYIVNAMYTPTENNITIPTAYIQKPFVDLEERGIEYNLTRIGFTIGHEMSHALDDWGSKYDEKGKLNNWWTEKDKKAFEKIQKNVVMQYEKFASYDGIKFDAWPSIGEDLADISGLTICREYLRDFQLKNEDELPIVDLSFRAFFVYFAIQQRQKISQAAITAQLKSNPHPLDKYRCNVPLSRLPTFRTIYNVKKGDKMWWPSTNRVWED
jgi:predicted metalloendopeptidase